MPAVAPPSTGSVTPVMYAPSSLHKKTTALAMSQASPIRPNKLRRARTSSATVPTDASIGVAMMPGSTAFTRTLSRPYAPARSIVNPSWAAFEAQYAGCEVPESRMPAIDPMLTIEPPPRSISAGIANLHARNEPVRLTPMTSS